MSELIFRNNVYMKECDSSIIDVPEPCCVILDRTIFFPEGGGQPHDKGTIAGFEVDYVYESGGKVIHRLVRSNPEQPHPEGLAIGRSVHCVLDWTRRFDHMQRHCGEHILSGIFFRDFGGVNKGFHMGEEYMTIDIDLPAVSEQMAAHAEIEANKVIWSDAPVSVRYFPNGSDAAHLPLRKELVLEDNVSIVCVGNEDNPADCVACCGTHPDSAGQVGMIKIMKTESYKGMSRIYFEAGQRAFRDYVRKHNLTCQLMAKYSSDEASLIDKLRIQDEKNDAIRQELHRCKDELMDREAASLLEDIAIPGVEDGMGSQIVVREYERFTAEDLQTLAKKICAASAHLFILISLKEKTLLLCSGNKSPDVFDCGRLVRENAGACGGKGGGSAKLARVTFSDYEDMDRFVCKLADIL